MKILLPLFLPIMVFVTANAITFRELRQWSQYKTQFGKSFSSRTEEKVSRANFLKSLHQVNEHNLKYKRGEVSYTMGLNHLSDMRTDEFLSKLNGLKIDGISNETIQAPITLTSTETLTSTTLPIEYNDVWSGWDIRNQGSCGSCWSFSVCASIESAYHKKTGLSYDCSEQHLTDCVYAPPKYGCGGGFMTTAFDYIKGTNGTIDERYYAYTATNGTCKASGLPRSVQLNSTTAYYKAPTDDDSIKSLICKYGSLTSAVAVDAAWQNYKSGVYTATTVGPAVHAITLCGWGTLNGTFYWIIRNSWGPTWGDSGYIWCNGQRTTSKPDVTVGGVYLGYTYGPYVLG